MSTIQQIVEFMKNRPIEIHYAGTDKSLQWSRDIQDVATWRAIAFSDDGFLRFRIIKVRKRISSFPEWYYRATELRIAMAASLIIDEPKSIWSLDPS